MLRSTKILLIFFLFTTFIFLLFPFVITQAEEYDPNKLTPDIKVKIGGTTAIFKPVECQGYTCEIGWISDYIGAVFKYGVGLAAVLAVVMIMVGGFLWLISGGSPDRVGKAKEFISSALLGLFLALFSYTLLYTINPRLVALEPIVVPKVKQIEIKYDEMTQERADALLKYGPMKDATYQDTHVKCQTQEGCSRCVSSVIYHDRRSKIYDPISGVVLCRWSNGFCVPSVPENSEVSQATPCVPVSN